jgi:Ca2+:H+ antiporter
MLFPAIFDLTARRMHDPLLSDHEERVSIGTSIVLLIVYAFGLLFTLRTHSHIFSRPPAASEEDKPGFSAVHPTGWTVKRSVIVLLIASAGVGVVAELLVGAAEKTAHNWGWSPIFVGVILLAIIGNAAEHSTAVMLAMRDDMETAMTICYQSSVQIALFATPFLVLLSWAMWASGSFKEIHAPMNLVFSPMEVVAVMLTVGIVVVLGMNGETNWFEGVLLLALYLILGIAFFYIPGGHEAAVQSGNPATLPAAAHP